MVLLTLENLGILLFTLTLLLAPSLAYILRLEEEVERKDGLHHFYHNHKDVFCP